MSDATLQRAQIDAILEDLARLEMEFGHPDLRDFEDIKECWEIIDRIEKQLYALREVNVTK
jgi:hypothetical protein